MADVAVATRGAVPAGRTTVCSRHAGVRHLSDAHHCRRGWAVARIDVAADGEAAVGQAWRDERLVVRSRQPTAAAADTSPASVGRAASADTTCARRAGRASVRIDRAGAGHVDDAAAVTLLQVRSHASRCRRHRWCRASSPSAPGAPPAGPAAVSGPARPGAAGDLQLCAAVVPSRDGMRLDGRHVVGGVDRREAGDECATGTPTMTATSVVRPLVRSASRRARRSAIRHAATPAHAGAALAGRGGRAGARPARARRWCRRRRRRAGTPPGRPRRRAAPRG